MRLTFAWNCPIFIQDNMSLIKHCIASQSFICLMFCLNIYTVFQCTSTSLQKSRAVVAWSLKLVCVNREVVKGHNEYWFACKFLQYSTAKLFWLRRFSIKTSERSCVFVPQTLFQISCSARTGLCYKPFFSTATALSTSSVSFRTARSEHPPSQSLHKSSPDDKKKFAGLPIW